MPRIFRSFHSSSRYESPAQREPIQTRIGEKPRKGKIRSATYPFLLPPYRSCESPPARPPSSDQSHLLRTTSHGWEANCKPYCHGLWDYRKSYASGIPKST
ncbi:hypothetical protein ACQJBY_001572 [Aegilops geniculata]